MSTTPPEADAPTPPPPEDAALSAGVAALDRAWETSRVFGAEHPTASIARDEAVSAWREACAEGERAVRVTAGGFASLDSAGALAPPGDLVSTLRSLGVAGVVVTRLITVDAVAGMLTTVRGARAGGTDPGEAMRAADDATRDAFRLLRYDEEHLLLTEGLETEGGESDPAAAWRRLSLALVSPSDARRDAAAHAIAQSVASGAMDVAGLHGALDAVAGREELPAAVAALLDAMPPSAAARLAGGPAADGVPDWMRRVLQTGGGGAVARAVAGTDEAGRDASSDAGRLLLRSLGAQASRSADDDPGAGTAQRWLASLAADGLDPDALNIAIEAGQSLLAEADDDATPEDYARDLDAVGGTAVVRELPGLSWTEHDTDRQRTRVLAALVGAGLTDAAASERLHAHLDAAVQAGNFDQLRDVFSGEAADAAAWERLTQDDALRLLLARWDDAPPAWRDAALTMSLEAVLDLLASMASKTPAPAISDGLWRRVRAAAGPAGWTVALADRPGLRRACERAWKRAEAADVLAELTPCVESGRRELVRWAVAAMEHYAGQWPNALADALLASDDAWVVARASRYLVEHDRWAFACAALARLQQSKAPREATAARLLCNALTRVTGNAEVSAAVKRFRRSPAWWATTVGGARHWQKEAA